MLQKPQIRLETISQSVDYDGAEVPDLIDVNFKEVEVGKYDKWGHRIYHFMDLFHNMQLTESEYDEEGHHIKSVIRDLLRPEQEPIIILGEFAEPEEPDIQSDRSSDDSYRIDIETTYQKCDKYNNWILERRVFTETMNRGIAGIHKRTIASWWRRDIIYFDSPNTITEE